MLSKRSKTIARVVQRAKAVAAAATTAALATKNGTNDGATASGSSAQAGVGSIVRKTHVLPIELYPLFLCMEGVGFEPTIIISISRFTVYRFKPLSHPS
jgi:hypothetical protein